MNGAMTLAIFISCMGLLGLATFTVRQRTKEIAIRKLLGASVSRIILMLNKDIIVLIIIKMIVVFPVAWYCMHGRLQNFAYRVSINGWLFLIAGLATASLALLMISYLTINAVIANPAHNLRKE